MAPRIAIRRYQNEIAMNSDSTDEQQKLIRIWSSRRGREVLIRLLYDVEEENGCKVYRLQKNEELE